MDKQKITLELASMLNEEDRDFKEYPITERESQALMLALYTLISDPATNEEDAMFYLDCLFVVKANSTFH